MPTFYVTTPIYYVNDLPHIGHVYTTVVADTVARYRRLVGDEVYFATGTDEHGVNILRIAEKKGITPQAQADSVVSRYHDLWKQIGVSHDDFIRTTEPRHHRAVAEIVRRIEAAGDLYVDKHEGWYCASCETFYTEKEIGAGKECPVHESVTEWQSEENIFFRLSKYQDRLLEWYAQGGTVQPESRSNEVKSFVESGLRDISVSRAGLPWGVPFPGHEGQTVYVWLEALTNYLSVLGFGGEAGDAAPLYERFWAGASDRRVHLVGKDILRFHAVYWPAFLMSAGLPLPTTVYAHGWWLRDAKKVSKSVGNIVKLDELFAHFGVDPVRYFLLREMVFGQDASFSDEAFVDRFNSDLANDLGNTLSRLVKLSDKAYGGKTPPESCSNNPVKATAEAAIPEYLAHMEGYAFHDALRSLWKILAEVNQYLVSREPWKALKAGEVDDRVSRVLWNGLEGVRLVAVGLLPFMPTLAARVLRAVGADPGGAGADDLQWGRLPLSADLPEKQTLFPRIDKAAFLAGKLEAPPADAGTDEEVNHMISIDQFFKTELKVATVIEAERIPKSKKLLKLGVEMGEERRTVVAGIAEAYEPEDLVGKQVVVVANLQPVKLMGVESQGMVLAAELDGKPVLLHPADNVPSGTPVK